MNTRRSLSGLAAVALLAASVSSVSAHAASSGSVGGSEALNRSDDVCAEPTTVSTERSSTGPVEATEGPSFEGTVAAVDYQSGQLILRTDDGLVNLTAAPEDIEDVNVGDVIRVALADDLSG
jgi:hypothetical protein